MENLSVMDQLETIAEEMQDAPPAPVAIPEDDTEAVEVAIVLPDGFEFRSLKQKHLMAFFEEYDPAEEHKSIHHMRYVVVKAAIVAGWFERPLGLSGDEIDDWSNDDMVMLTTAINNYYTQVTTIKKK